MKEQSSSSVRVRFAPSPTGYLHIGSLRTTLYNWLMARRHGGVFVLRLEDTDRSRYVPGAIEKMYESLVALDLKPDEGLSVQNGQLVDRGEFGPYLQSLRRTKHETYAKRLIAQGDAYFCFCSTERLAALAEEQKARKVPTMYDRACRSLAKDEAVRRVAAGETHVIRLAVPLEGSCVFEDEIHGRIEIPWAQVDDQVLIKSDGFPTYHLAATTDDHDMQITHVIRGDEWISSMPKHVFIAQALGWEPPLYAHLPLLLNADRSKLSKRQGDVAVEDYLSKGYLPEALINFVALLGWNPTADREIFTKEELVALFDLKKVNKAGAVFNLEKLNWLNAHYLRQKTNEEYFAFCQPWVAHLSDDRALLERACLIVRERIQLPSEIPDTINFIFKAQLEHDPAVLIWKKSTTGESRQRLVELREWLANQSDEIFSSVEKIETKVRTLIVEREWGNGDTLWPLRVALSGAAQSPSPFELLFVYGQARALERIDEALTRLA